MIDSMHRLATRLRPFRLVIAATALLCLALLLYVLLGRPARSDTLLQAAILATLWAGLMFAFVDLFRQLPRLPSRGDGFFLRVKLELVRAFFVVLALFVIFATLALVWTTARLAFL